MSAGLRRSTSLTGRLTGSKIRVMYMVEDDFDYDYDLSRLQRCLSEPRMGLCPAVYVSSREMNRLGRDELRELQRRGLSSIGVQPVGARSAVYAIENREDVKEVTDLLEEKGIKYRETTAWTPLCEE